MPTIVQINSTINVGSTGRIAEQIGAKAMARGWTSCAVYGRACGDSSSIVISIGSIVGVWLHAILTRITDRHGLFSRIATKRLVRKIEEISPDIVHLHNIHGYYVNYKMLFDYLCKSDIKIVWTLHDCWPITGHCAHFECAQCDRWKSGCYGCPEKHSYPRSIGIDRSRKNYIEKRDAFTSVNNMTIVPVSIWLGNILKESFLKQYDIEVIHNGIDIGTFRPVDDRGLREKYGIAGKKVILGVASPWSERKGLEDFKKMSAILPDNRYQLVMIGLQGRQLKMLPEGVIGLSRTSNVEELAAWYSLADVFVNPTYEDTYPTTNLEAISCGTPVVTYRTGGAPESLTSNTGRVVSRGDVKGLVEAIESICSEDREIMREHCREYAEMHFDKNKCFEKYMSLYENLINK